MTNTPRTRAPIRRLAALATAIPLALASAGVAGAFDSGGRPSGTGANTITWTGQGAVDGSLGTVECAAGQTPSGTADEAYLHWVLTTDGGTASGAVLHLGGSGSGDYTGTANPGTNQWYFDTPYSTPDSALAATASLQVLTTGRGAWILTISHGCPGSTDDPPLEVTKTATGSVTTTYDWTVAKSADPTVVHATPGASNDITYGVVVTHDAGTVVTEVTGTITVSNPNDGDATGVDIADTIDNGGTCTVVGGSDATVPAGSSTFDYSCAYETVPNLTGVVNTATVSWPTQTLDGGTLEGGTATFSTDPFDLTSSTVDECVDVTDAFNGGDAIATTPGTVCVGDPNPTSISYHRYITSTADVCTSYGNTAATTTNDTGTVDEASASVSVCGNVTGGLTIGFWQNRNGQGLITNAGPSTGTCSLTPILRAYAPFQDLSATARCSAVATYVANVVKAANASGASMNAMLRAQMLATVLSVWQKPSLASTNVDLTLVCSRIGSCGVPETSPTGYINAASAFGSPPAATCRTLGSLLAYAASQSNVGGSLWYANTKSVQELAKDTFDAVNNNVAWAC